MDHGAWPFSVGGVACLVNFVSMCEGGEKKKREDERENEVR